MKRFYPDLMLKSAYEITPQLLKEKGISGLVLDIDNTLSEYKMPHPAPHTLRFFEEMRAAGIGLIILSNGGKTRVSRYLDGVSGIGFRYSSKKPLQKGFRWAAETLALPPSKIAVVGDQIYTDVWGGNKGGFFTILTEPFDEKECFLVGIKRLLEKPILWAYRKKLQKGKK